MRFSVQRWSFVGDAIRGREGEQTGTAPKRSNRDMVQNGTGIDRATCVLREALAPLDSLMAAARCTLHKVSGAEQV